MIILYLSMIVDNNDINYYKNNRNGYIKNVPEQIHIFHKEVIHINFFFKCHWTITYCY